MPYHLSLRAPNLLHITLQGFLPLEVAEAFAQDTWQLLDECPNPTNLLFDGRSIKEASNTARRRVEQVLRHPGIGHMAFVVNQQHVPFLMSVVQFTQGIALFNNEHAALSFLHNVQTLPLTQDMHQQPASQPARAPVLTASIPATQTPEQSTSEHLANTEATVEHTQQTLSASAARTLHCLMDMLDNDMTNIDATYESSYTSKW